MVVRTTSAKVIPPAASTPSMFFITRSVWFRMSPGTISIVAGSSAICPAQ